MRRDNRKREHYRGKHRLKLKRIVIECIQTCFSFFGRAEYCCLKELMVANIKL